jgi:hypothetical protein
MKFIPSPSIPLRSIQDRLDEGLRSAQDSLIEGLRITHLVMGIGIQKSRKTVSN